MGDAWCVKITVLCEGSQVGKVGLPPPFLCEPVLGKSGGKPPFPNLDPSPIASQPFFTHHVSHITHHASRFTFHVSGELCLSYSLKTTLQSCWTWRRRLLLSKKSCETR